MPDADAPRRDRRVRDPLRSPTPSDHEADGNTNVVPMAIEDMNVTANQQASIAPGANESRPVAPPPPPRSGEPLFPDPGTYTVLEVD